MTKEEFKEKWESNDEGGGITFDDIADCAISWGISKYPKTRPINLIRYQVLQAANTNDYQEYDPFNDEEE
jgi:hypothetical protein